MSSRFGGLVLGVGMLLAAVHAASAAPPTAPAAHAAPPAPPPAARPASPTTGADNGSATREAAPQVSQDAAARARMHECGHQWSAIKKAGNAGTMTWKDFSATCLVVSK